MLGRRRVLSGLLGAGAVALHGMPAEAVSPSHVAGAGRRPLDGTARMVRRDNCSFLNEARAILADDVAHGAAMAGSERTVFCPLCRESITLTS